MLRNRIFLFVAFAFLSFAVKGEDFMIVSVTAKHSLFLSYVKRVVKNTPNKKLTILLEPQNKACVFYKPQNREMRVVFDGHVEEKNVYWKMKSSFLAKLIVEMEDTEIVAAQFMVECLGGRGRLYVTLKRI